MKKPNSKTAKYYNIIDFNKAKKEMEPKELIDFLVQKKFFKISKKISEEELKSLNPKSFNQFDWVYDYFASINFNGKYYVLTEPYIEEASCFIMKTASIIGEQDLKKKLEQYDLKNEHFISLDDLKDYYKKEYEKLTTSSIYFQNKFGKGAYDYDSKEFQIHVKNYIEKELHHCTPYNTNYLTGLYQNLDLIPSDHFGELVKLVGIERLIEYVRHQLFKKDLKTADLSQYSTFEIVAFFEYIGFLKDTEIVSIPKQAKFISKLTGKSSENIRKTLYKIESKKYTDRIYEAMNKVRDDMIKSGYPEG